MRLKRIIYLVALPVVVALGAVTWRMEGQLVPVTNTVALADRLRGVIEGHAFDGVGGLTASFGASDFAVGDSVVTLPGRADRALYRAKQGGRNLVVAAD